jgi:hypothetical protein
MANHPASKEFVITRVELVFVHPEIVRKAVQKLRVFENDGAIRGSSA